MLELYHQINSVSAQKVRLALAEKGIAAKEHPLTLQGDQFNPDYLRLNPSAVVPTLVHDGNVIVEASVIVQYIDEVFPSPPLMPEPPVQRAAVRRLVKLVDDHVHLACVTLTFAIALRPGLQKIPPPALAAALAKAPWRQASDRKREAVAHGLASRYAQEAIDSHRQLLRIMEEMLDGSGPFLAGSAYSLAEAVAIPYVLRLDVLQLGRLYAELPNVSAWAERIRHRSSTNTAIWDRMDETDWAIFKPLGPEVWNQVSAMSTAPAPPPGQA